MINEIIEKVNGKERVFIVNTKHRFFLNEYISLGDALYKVVQVTSIFDYYDDVEKMEIKVRRIDIKER